MKDILKLNPQIQSVYLKVSEGGLYVAPTLVQTVLGSCLGASFHAPARAMGAFFHAFLPRLAEYPQFEGESVFKFVDTAFDHVFTAFARKGIHAADLTVSLMGGANGLVGDSAGVGARNIEAAYEALEKYHVKPVFVDTGGAKGRKVFFLSGTGELKITKLSGTTGLQNVPPGAMRRKV
ncbi:chemotaxis protein CheD [Fundidesulfovibrio terrae]|uniref:chemotaxis protein CheD n=1 Tax=Fundidesulfovibrio terrae TaxID=2922866 RepID=UPI001FAFCAE1|nr:chemotaxis protein CheD [Fundidesulfovibrio terrae]